MLYPRIVLRLLLDATLLNLFLLQQSNSQQQKKTIISVSISFGGGIVSTPNPFSITTDRNYQPAVYHTGWYANAAIQFGPWQMQSDVEWSFQIETSACGMKSADFIFNRESMHLNSYHFPLLFWYRVNNKNDLHFFLQAGAGGVFQITEYQWSQSEWERYTYWSFAWGIGSGISYRFNLHYTAEVFFNLISLEGSKFLDYTNGYSSIVNDRFMLIPIGVNVRYRL